MAVLCLDHCFGRFGHGFLEIEHTARAQKHTFEFVVVPNVFNCLDKDQYKWERTLRTSSTESILMEKLYYGFPIYKNSFRS